MVGKNATNVVMMAAAVVASAASEATAALNYSKITQFNERMQIERNLISILLDLFFFSSRSNILIDLRQLIHDTYT